MPRRSYPPTQSWRTFLRNQALGIGMIGFGEAGRISDQLLTLVRGWIERVVGCAIKVRDGVSCMLIEPSWTLHPLGPSRPCNGTDQRAIHGGCMPVRARRTAQCGDQWTMAGRRLSPYRSRASPRLNLPAFTKFARSTGCRALAPATHVFWEQAKRFRDELFAQMAIAAPSHTTISKTTPANRVRGSSYEDTHPRRVTHFAGWYERGMSRLFRTYRAPLSQYAMT